MDSRSLFYCLLALLPLLYLTKYYVASKRSRRRAVRLPPGPWLLPIIGSLHHLLGAHPHRALRDISRRYGPLVFLKFGEVPVVVASSREAAKAVMKTHDAVFATRPQTATVKMLTKQAMAILLAPYGDHWRQLRKICVLELLSARRVQSFRPVREVEAARLVQAVSSTSSPLVNLSALLDAYSVDTTVHSIMGNRLKVKERDAFLRYIDEGTRLVGSFSLADLFPSSWLAGALSCWKAHRVEAFVERLFAFLDCIIREHIERRSQEEEALQEDLIDVLLRIRSQGSNKSPLTMGTIKAVVLDLFGAGADSVATTLQWTMTELMRNPSVMSRAQAEVRGAFVLEMKVTEDGLCKLSYLHCVIRESLRLHPPGPILLPRECQETCQVMGYDVPKGTMVLVNAWAISRDPQYWEEPETFNPERFECDTRDFKGNDFDLTPFGAGRRICPGMSFGLANVELALANLLFHFDWRLPNGLRPNELDVTECMGISAARKKDLWLGATVSVQQPH